MIVNLVNSKWIEKSGYRMDCGPFVKGAFQARMVVEDLQAPKFLLRDLVSKTPDGNYKGKMLKRTFVDSQEYGVPFVTTTGLTKFDTSKFPLISTNIAKADPNCLLKEKTIQVSAAGTIGRVSMSRIDMVGMFSCSDNIKLNIDEKKVSPEYVYAFLAGKFGQALVCSGTYGSIIRHLDTKHLDEISIPVLDIEPKITDLISQVNKLRYRASELMSEVRMIVKRELGPIENGGISSVASSKLIQRRMDSFYHSEKVVKARDLLSGNSDKTVFDYSEKVFEPNRGARYKVEDESYGVPFISSSEVFKLNPKGEYFISRTRTPHFENLEIKDTDVLIPRSGQLGGIIGNAVLPYSSYYGCAGSEHLVRVRCKSQDDAFYLWSILDSQQGYLAAIGTAFGSSIPSLDCELIGNIRIPNSLEIHRDRIITAVREMVNSLSMAANYETKAIASLEDAIEAAAPKH